MSLPRPATAVLALAAASLFPATARAESYHTCAGFIDSLPAVITTQGTWCLRGDLATAMASGNAIDIRTNNVTIDCNGFKIGGLAAGPATATDGIALDNRLNATVRHCSIRGFYRGVAFLGDGGGHLVEDNRFDANTFMAIKVHGDGSIIRRNTVFDTGGSFSAAWGIEVFGNADVRDNVVDGFAVLAGHPNTGTIGIALLSNYRGAIVGNRVGGLVSSGAGVAYGILHGGSYAVTHRDNILVGDGRLGGTGIQCNNAYGLAVDNTVMGFDTPVAGCVDIGTTP